MPARAHDGVVIVVDLAARTEPHPIVDDAEAFHPALVQTRADLSRCMPFGPFHSVDDASGCLRCMLDRSEWWPYIIEDDDSSEVSSHICASTLPTVSSKSRWIRRLLFQYVIVWYLASVLIGLPV